MVFGLGIGSHAGLFGHLYDKWSHKGAFAVVFGETFVYWVALTIFIGYRKFIKKYKD